MQKEIVKNCFKLGIDYHLTFTNDYAFFNKIFCKLKDKYNNNLKIIIITGAYADEKIENVIMKTLKKDQYKWWNDVFMIPSFLINGKNTLESFVNGKPIFNDDAWCKSKALYCKENNIDLHIDNNINYLVHFKTPFILYTGEKDIKINGKSLYSFLDEEIENKLKQNNKY